MSRSWKKRTPCALLLAFWVMMGSVARAETPADKPTTLDDIKTLVESLKTQLDTLKSVELKALKAQIDSVKNDTTTTTPLIIASSSQVKDILLKVERLSDRMADLDRKIKELDTRFQSSQTDVKKALDLTPRRTTGTVRLENRSRVRSTVVLNNVAYELQPGEVREIRDWPAGNIDYYVLADGFGQISPSVTRTVVPGAVRTIEINP